MPESGSLASKTALTSLEVVSPEGAKFTMHEQVKPQSELECS